jgi:hypothetical protein
VADGLIPPIRAFNFDITFAVKEALLSDLEEIPTLKVGEYVFHLEVNDMTPEVKEIAKNELRETPEVSKEAVITLRDLLRGKECFHLATLESASGTFQFCTKCLLIIQVYWHVTFCHCMISPRRSFLKCRVLFTQRHDFTYQKV